MSVPQETQTPAERTMMYFVVGAIVITLAVLGLNLFSSAKDSKQAGDKADKVIASLAATGARTPDREQVIRVLGTDGGAVCTDPNKALSHAILLSELTNGAAGPGQRPVVVDSKVFQGQKLIMQTYCPDQLSEFQKFVGDLKTAGVAGG